MLIAENFYQISSLRPVAVIKEGRLIELKIPGNHFYYVKNPHSHDLILFHGTEPHLRWNVFADTILDLAEKYDVPQIFTIGGTYDYIPHTFPPVVSALYNHEELKEVVIRTGLGLTEYRAHQHPYLYFGGCQKEGFEGNQFWGMPQHLQTKNTKWPALF
jgi:proteasome assembly chaperone (PAC2) family protein